MAYKRRRRQKRMKRRFGRKYGKKKRGVTKLNNRNVLSYKYPTTLPNYFNTIVEWTLLYSVASASGSPFITQNIHINDLNDPGAALAATRPRYVTDIMTMYGRYIVHGFSCKIIGTSQPDTTSTGDQIHGCFPAVSAAQAANITNVPSALAAQRCKWAIASRYGNQVSHVKNFIKLKTLMGCHDLADDPANIGQSSAAPVNVPVMVLFAGTQDATGSAGVNLVVKCRFYVTFMRRDNENLPAAV